MILKDVITELASRLNDIDGLRVYPYPPDSVSVPSGIFALPDEIVYDQTYGRGSDKVELPLLLLVGRVNDRGVFERIGPYVDGSGDSSVKQFIESGTYTAMHTATVVRCQFDVITWGTTDYVAAIFTLAIFGQGA